MLLLRYFSPFSLVEDPHVMDAIPIQTVSSYLSKHHHLEIQHRNAQRFVPMVILNRVSFGNQDQPPEKQICERKRVKWLHICM